MLFHKRGSLELLDQLYSLGFWMTGSPTNTSELVYRTYQQADSHTSEFGLLKTFREVYHEHAGEESPDTPDEACTASHRKQEADMRLAVLFVEIFGLRHLNISIIMDQPLETIRLWLSAGRKSFCDQIDGCIEPSLSC